MKTILNKFFVIFLLLYYYSCNWSNVDINEKQNQLSTVLAIQAIMGPSASDIVLQPNAKPLTESDTAKIITVSENYDNVVFSKGNFSYKQGDVLIAAPFDKASKGFLLKVDKVEEQDSGYKLITSDADLTDAFVKLKINFEGYEDKQTTKNDIRLSASDVLSDGSIKNVNIGLFGVLSNNKFKLVDKDEYYQSLSKTLEFNGSFSYKTLYAKGYEPYVNYEPKTENGSTTLFSLYIDNSEVKSINYLAGIELEMNTGIDININGFEATIDPTNDHSNQYQFLQSPEVSLPPIGVFKPYVSVGAGIIVKGSTSIAAKYSKKIFIPTVGIMYENYQWKHKTSNHFINDQPINDILNILKNISNTKIEVEPFLTPTLSLRLLHKALPGIKIVTKPYLNLQHTVYPFGKPANTDPCCKYGVKVDIHVEPKVFSWKLPSYSREVIDLYKNFDLCDFSALKSSSICKGSEKPTVSFTPIAGEYNSVQSVILNCAADPNAIGPNYMIYTLDKSIPSHINGSAYKNPISISADTTINAICIDGLGIASDMFSHTYIIKKAIINTPPTLTVSPVNGSYSSAINVNLSCSSSIPQATTSIAYTTDGTEPSFNSSGQIANGTLYTSSINVSTSKNIKSICRDSSGNLSTTSSNSYIVQLPPPPEKPTVSSNYSSGTYNSAIGVTLTCNTFVAGSNKIAYTTNGTNPTFDSNGNITSGNLYSGSISYSTNGTYKLISICRNSVGSVSDNLVLDFILNITQPPPINPPTVSISPNEGTYGSTQNVTISCTANVSGTNTTSYTTNGTTPNFSFTNGSTQYTVPFTLSSSATVKAICKDKDGRTSSVVQKVYTIDSAAPTITITSATPTSIGNSGSVSLVWTSNYAGSYQIRIGSSNCTDGTLSTGTNASGNYTTGFITSTVPTSQLVSGSNSIKVCLTNSLGNKGSQATTITKDSTLPTISSLSITSGSTISSLSTLDVTFSESVIGAATKTNYVLSGTSKGTLSVSSVSNVSGNTYRLVFSGSLASGTGTVTLTIQNITDSVSNAISNGTVSYSTNTVAPTISSVSPTSGSTLTSISSITINFSKIVNNASTGSNYSLSGTGKNTLYVSSVSGSGSSYTVYISGSPSSGSLTLTLNNITDTIGNALSGNTISYTMSVDTVKPTVSYTNPSNGATGISTSISPSVTFSESMQSSLVTSSTFYIQGVSGSISSSGNTFYFTPYSSLSSGTTYTVYVTTGVADLAGNYMQSTYSFSFTTAINQICTPNQSYSSVSCGTVNNGTKTQTKTCNSTGTDYVYGTCTISCNSTYTLDGSQCKKITITHIYGSPTYGWMYYNNQRQPQPNPYYIWTIGTTYYIGGMQAIFTLRKYDNSNFSGGTWYLYECSSSSSSIYDPATVCSSVSSGSVGTSNYVDIFLNITGASGTTKYYRIKTNTGSGTISYSENPISVKGEW